MVTHLKQTQSGRSMIEMLGVLAIVGVLSAGGIAGYSMAMQSYKTSALVEKVNLIAQQGRVLYNGQYSNTTDGENSNTTDGKMGKKLVSAGMITDLNNPFGGVLTVTGATTTFTVTSTANIPAEACIKLLRTNWGTTGVFTSVSATKGETTKSFYSAPGEDQNPSPATAAKATSACKDGNIEMEWTFK